MFLVNDYLLFETGDNMILFILLILLLSQKLTISKTLSQQYLFLLVLLFLCNRNTSNMNFNTQRNFNNAILAMNPYINSYSNNDPNMCHNKKLSLDEYHKKAHNEPINSLETQKNVKKHSDRTNLYAKNRNSHIFRKSSLQWNPYKKLIFIHMMKTKSLMHL